MQSLGSVTLFGDGFSDVAVTAGHGALPVDVLRGRTSAADIPFGALGSGGFQIVDSSNPGAGVTIARAGDVSGDGIPDLLVAEPFASPRGRANAGSVFVVFGKHDTNTVDLANLGNGGFRIDGALAGDQIGYNGSTGGWALAGGQDLNGDGKSDILIGATVDAGSRPAWVVFGKSSSSPVDLATLAADGNGYEIDPPAGKTFGSFGTGAGSDLALVSDLNGDGRGEAVLGVPGAATTYVAFGKASTSSLNLASLGTGGWTITGSFSQTAGSTCDFNGDGRPDVLVGDQSGSLGRNSNGQAWVIYGHATGNVDLTALTASQGIRFDGATSFEYASESALAGVGDVNGNGRCGIVIGAYQSNNTDGKAYVVYGRSTGSTEFDLAGLTAADGYVVTDGGQFASVGHGGDGAGDFNGDGRLDVVTDAPFAPGLAHAVGEADIIYGFGPPSIHYGAVSATVGSELTPLVPTVQRTGAESFSISPGLPPGLSFDPSTGAISGTPTAAHPATSYTVTMTDLVGTASATISLAVAPAPAADNRQADNIQVQKIEQQLSLGPGQTVTVNQDCPSAAPIDTDGSVRIDHVDQGTGDPDLGRRARIARSRDRAGDCTRAQPCGRLRAGQAVRGLREQ